jgi:hypothetical protein
MGRGVTTFFCTCPHPRQIHQTLQADRAKTPPKGESWLHGPVLTASHPKGTITSRFASIRPLDVHDLWVGFRALATGPAGSAPTDLAVMRVCGRKPA